MNALLGKRVAFVGKLGGLNRREVFRLVRQQGGIPVEQPDETADWIVIGADELPIDESGDLLTDAIRDAAAHGRLKIVGETEFWEALGLLDASTEKERQLYTPAMLADLLSVSVANVRRWHRLGLIRPVREVHRLPYFDFQEVLSARRLAKLLATGASPNSIRQKLAQLARYLPDVERPLAQLQIMVDGRRLLLRQGEGLIDSAGQFWIDFESLEDNRSSPAETVVRMPEADTDTDEETPSAAQLIEKARWLEDEGELANAISTYRVALVAGGPRADVCFELAELLYRVGDLPAARERYYMAIELDEDFVEARANLGCVLAETGESELAIAAFYGALKFHADYPDVHYHLARALDEAQQPDEAVHHWERFFQLSPDSPWAEEARSRLGHFG